MPPAGSPTPLPRVPPADARGATAKLSATAALVRGAVRGAEP
eukprot:CAMPEP_0177599820 /NCGR_PEP_ID=MMETSP0419_2-20121207/13230_1 /TAXON_ID=582737 /ORGANISM="Tetraselmis sp., Strain GSL018" /LENGTH=41 /DNA_ID= /DNA_START= /DNA_END= /DNA_ORIENTATION=